MTVTLVFLALLLAAFVLWLLWQSFNTRPWVAEPTAAERLPYFPVSATAPRVGLAVFMVVVTALFAIATSAYLMRMETGQDWRSLPAPGQLWVNTAALVLASVFLQGAWHAAKRAHTGALRAALAAGGACSVFFVVGQYLVWRQLADAGFYAATNPANAFFYMLTGLHALHLVGGLGVWTAILGMAWRGDRPAELRSSVELCAVYWHFLLVIWILLFWLVLAT